MVALLHCLGAVIAVFFGLWLGNYLWSARADYDYLLAQTIACYAVAATLLAGILPAWLGRWRWWGLSVALAVGLVVAFVVVGNLANAVGVESD